MIQVKKNVCLAPLTSFKIGGPAKYFLEAKNVDEVAGGLKWAKKNKIKYFVLGGGSNILISDRGFNGLVIKLLITNYKLLNNKLVVGVGTSLAKLVSTSIKAGLTGLEWAAGIPGTLGGAIYGNTGAMGHSISQSVEKIKVLRNGKIKNLKNKDAKFAYRKSIFQKNKDIILEIELKLQKGDKEEIKKLIKENLLKRSPNQPRYPSAGCVFKNFSLRLTSLGLAKLSEKYPELENFKKSGTVSAGWLIEKCGLKGKQIGQAQISEKHANFIVNLCNARAKDVIALINLVKKTVKNKFNFDLKEEIQYVDFK
ncbi:MAG: UDP-N-acetylmuramate dehydrogenase [Patescibacteria group bacterium]|nr:UDP-N-acetylmuramate dehydrogenase [Patescibacteria group bacterium]MDD5164039.1 UDP-N-acetylmuramate dehydrogenase [Patescibacteria group bacterium]MDD5534877.1 UDP-N-acetylmuramate dehydrogenase [Patescibacteria group bacterium]